LPTGTGIETHKFDETMDQDGLRVDLRAVFDLGYFCLLMVSCAPIVYHFLIVLGIRCDFHREELQE